MYGHNIIVHGISNGRSGVGVFVRRLLPILLITGDLVVDHVVPDEFSKNKGVQLSINRPYGKKYRKSFLGKSN
jgi:hypothetical protein